MTYQEFREQVITDVVDQMIEFQWTRDDADSSIGDCFAEYKAGKSPRQTASTILWRDVQPEELN